MGNLRKSCASFFWRSSVAVPKPVTAGSRLPVGMAVLLGPWAVCPQCGCPQHSPSSVPCACCSWGSLTYAILWLVQDIQYFTKTVSSGKQHLPVPRAACVCSFLSWPQRWCLAINSCLQNANEPLPLYSSFHSPGTSLPEDKIWTLGFVILFYYTEYCHFKRHIQQSSKCSCHLVPVVWQLFLAKSLLPFSTHKLWVLSWWCHQKTVITESCKKMKKKREHWIKNNLNSKYKK